MTIMHVHTNAALRQHSVDLDEGRRWHAVRVTIDSRYQDNDDQPFQFLTA